MTARSFRLGFGLVLKLFALETDYSRVVSLLREPKTLSCARVWLKKKTECYALCFSQQAKPTESKSVHQFTSIFCFGLDFGFGFRLLQTHTNEDHPNCGTCALPSVFWIVFLVFCSFRWKVPDRKF